VDEEEEDPKPEEENAEERTNETPFIVNDDQTYESESSGDKDEEGCASASDDISPSLPRDDVEDVPLRYNNLFICSLWDLF